MILVGDHDILQKVWFGLFDAKRPGKQFFRHVWTEPPLPGYYQYFLGVNMSSSRTQHGKPSGARNLTSGSGVGGVNHQATTPPRNECSPAIMVKPDGVL